MVRLRIPNAGGFPALAAVLRYGLAFTSVAAALGLSLILIYSGLPRLFGVFSLAAISIAFWFGGTGPGILSVLLSTLAFSHFLFPVKEVRGPGWESFLAIYAMFGGLVGWFSATRHRAERLLAEARDSLDKRVAARTSELARAEQELRQSEEHLRLVIDTVPALIHTGRPDGYLDYFNRRWLEYVGLPLAELAGWKWMSAFHPEDVGAVVEKWRAALETGEPFTYEARLRRADGEYRWMFLRKVPLRDERGNIVKWYGSAIDIEHRKRAEEALRLSEERWRAVFENSAVGIALSDPRAKYLTANRAYQQMVGYTDEELQALSYLDITYEEDRQINRDLVAELVEGKREQFSVEKRYRRKDGTLIWVRITVSEAHDADGKFQFGMAIVEDITERKRAEDDLRRQKEVLQKIFDNAPVMIAFLGPDSKLSLINRAFERTLGWTLEELRAVDLNDLLARFYPDPKARQQALKFMSSASPEFADLSVRVRDGQLMESSWGKAHLSDGTEIYIGRDITERKRAEEALCESEQRYRNFISHSTEGVWRLELQRPLAVGVPEQESVTWLLQHGYIAECNDAFAQIVGFHRTEEVEGKRFGDLVPASDEERIESFRSAARGGWQSRTIEFRGRDQAGNLKYLLRTEIPIIENGKLARIWGLTRDLTKRKRAEEALRESEERFRTIFENAGVGMALVDLDGHPIKTNPALRQMLGYSEEELSRMLFTEFTYPEDRQLDWRLYGELAAGKRDNYEIEKRYLKKDGGVVWGLLVVSLVKERQGRPMYCVGMVEDITKRKLAEEALRESEHRYRMLFERNMAGVYRTTLDGRILECNQAMANILGFRSPEEAKESRGQDNYFSEQERISFIERLETEGHLTNFEIHRRRNDGTPIWLIANLSLITQAPGGQRILEGTFVDITERKRAELALQRSRDQLRALAVRLQNVREEERTRVAREIHDELGQALTAIKIDLSSLSHDLPAERKHRYESIMKLADETIQSVRRISTELRPAILDTSGLVAAVEWAAEEFETRTGTHCRLDLPQDEIFVDQNAATALFRIFQETLTNVARHANATEVNVRLARDGGNLTLEVHDNGKGVGEEQLSANDSLGILGMRERALLLGGEFTITGAAGKGTTVIARIPEIRPTLAKEDV